MTNDPKSAELSAAVARLRRARTGESLGNIYAPWPYWQYEADRKLCVDAYLATVAADDQLMRELLSRIRDISSRIGLARHPLEIKGELDGLVLLYERGLNIALQPSEQETQS